jgi:hypothetical protein
VSRIFCEFVQLSLDIFQLYPYLDTVTLSLCKLTILQKCEVFTNMLKHCTFIDHTNSFT